MDNIDNKEVFIHVPILLRIIAEKLPFITKADKEVDKNGKERKRLIKKALYKVFMDCIFKRELAKHKKVSLGDKNHKSRLERAFPAIYTHW